jgi:hypothetical protein
MEVYRVAFDEASAELNEILVKFEQLRTRKDRLEKVVEALKPLLATGEVQAPAAGLHIERTATPAPVTVPMQTPAAAPVMEHAAMPVMPPPQAPAPSTIPYPVQQAVEETNDPFSRRAENAVGLGSAARDVREYSRLFNTGTSR